MAHRPLQLLALALALGAPAAAFPQTLQAFSARLNGYRETPSIATPGVGTFTVTVTPPAAGQTNPTIQFTLNYSGLSAAATAAHIHLGQRGVPGGIAVNLCGAGSAPACPAQGPLSGTIDATAVVGPTDQGIAAGELQKVIDAMIAGATYVNVHTATFPAGEIRGQIGADLGLGD